MATKKTSHRISKGLCLTKKQLRSWEDGTATAAQERVWMRHANKCSVCDIAFMEAMTAVAENEIERLSPGTLAKARKRSNDPANYNRSAPRAKRFKRVVYDGVVKAGSREHGSERQRRNAKRKRPNAPLRQWAAVHLRALPKNRRRDPEKSKKRFKCAYCGRPTSVGPSSGYKAYCRRTACIDAAFGVKSAKTKTPRLKKRYKCVHCSRPTSMGPHVNAYTGERTPAFCHRTACINAVLGAGRDPAKFRSASKRRLNAQTTRTQHWWKVQVRYESWASMNDSAVAEFFVQAKNEETAKRAAKTEFGRRVHGTFVGFHSAKRVSGPSADRYGIGGVSDRAGRDAETRHARLQTRNRRVNKNLCGAALTGLDWSAEEFRHQMDNPHGKNLCVQCRKLISKRGRATRDPAKYKSRARKVPRHPPRGKREGWKDSTKPLLLDRHTKDNIFEEANRAEADHFNRLSETTDSDRKRGRSERFRSRVGVKRKLLRLAREGRKTQAERARLQRGR